jgi:hypothetical protein
MTHLLPPFNRILRKRLEHHTGMKIVVKICALRFTNNNRRVGFYSSNKREEKIKVMIVGQRNVKLVDLANIKKFIIKDLGTLFEVCDVPGKLSNVIVTFHF